MKRKDIEQKIFGNIFLLANFLQTKGDKLLKDITLKQWFLLIIVFNMPIKEPSINEIAQFMKTSRQNIKKMTVVLENKGYLYVKKSKTDLRSYCVTLSEKTFLYFKEFDETGNAFLDRLFFNIDNHALEQTLFVMEQIFQNMNFEEKDGTYIENK